MSSIITIRSSRDSWFHRTMIGRSVLFSFSSSSHSCTKGIVDSASGVGVADPSHQKKKEQHKTS